MRKEKDDSFTNAQHQIRQNAFEQNEFLKDLHKWEKEMHAIEAEAKLKSNKTSGGSQKASKPSDSDSTLNHQMNQLDPQELFPISGVVMKAPLPKVYHSSSITDKNLISKTYLSEEERLRGNSFFSESKYEEAIEAYTRALQVNPNCATTYSNRAMTYIKMKEWQNAEVDATLALNIDPLHLKSYQRRSIARQSQGKIRASLLDLYRVRTIAENLNDNSDHIIKIQQDIDKMQSLLLQAIKKAPKKSIPIKIIRDESNEQ